MSFNYLTNSSGFTRIAAYVGQMVDQPITRRTPEAGCQEPTMIDDAGDAAAIGQHPKLCVVDVAPVRAYTADASV